MSSSYKQQSPPYKKYQCRYFHENGQPLHTPCNQGDRCRFVHPTDPNWPGLKCHPFPTKPGSYSNPHKTPGQVRNTRAARLGAPLVSQTDLFRLECKVETEDDGTLLHDPRPYSDNKPSARDDDRPYTLKEKIVRGQNRDTDNKLQSEERTLSGDWQNDFNTKTASRAPEQGVVRPPACPNNQTFWEKAGCATKMVDVVRNIAKLSNQVVQDATKHAENERSLKNFNEISATLSKISASAAAAVATPLTDTIIDHVRSQERMEANLTALEEEWGRFFETFTTEITGIIERSVDEAVAKLHREIMQSSYVSSSGKRKQIEGSSLSDEEYSRRRIDDYSRSYESKRRRISPSPTRRESEAFKASFEDLLGRLDQQKNTLQWLQKENNELKQKLDERR
ncbi:hypothetical protein L218DRAFT_198141 [Marasmius fiardii PR-910]|nr:hypothetical protein L218DRAFT_198141 [Marasmius fiardii PR-910]